MKAKRVKVAPLPEPVRRGEYLSSTGLKVLLERPPMYQRTGLWVAIHAAPERPDMDACYDISLADLQARMVREEWRLVKRW